MPEPAAMRAASTLVGMPPVPTPALPALPMETPSRSCGPATCGIRLAPCGGRTVVEGVDVGEQHQRVGPDQVRHEGGQPVVVAEADLVRGDGVVLVDDGHHAEVQQPVQGTEGVRCAGCAA